MTEKKIILKQFLGFALVGILGVLVNGAVYQTLMLMSLEQIQVFTLPLFDTLPIPWEGLKTKNNIREDAGRS